MWFKVSDDMTEHPKVKAMPRGPKRKLALATWLGCGTWCQGGLTDGLVSLDVVLDKGGTKPEAALLVQVGLWHDRNSTCDHAPDQCPGPPSGTGEYTFHDWFVYQRDRVYWLAERSRNADKQARLRSRRSEGSNPVTDPVTNPASNLPPGPGPVPGNPLLTLISRLAAGDAGATTPPAEVVEGWQEIAGPGVDLDAEALAYLVRYGDRPARDERGAWLGWLRRAAQREDDRHRLAALDPDADIRPPAGCSDPACSGGFLGADVDDRPVPCPSCRPHLPRLRAVAP